MTKRERMKDMLGYVEQHIENYGYDSEGKSWQKDFVMNSEYVNQMLYQDR